MVLPDDFSPWEHLQTVLMQVHNRIVRNEFKDLGEDEWEENITTPRSSLRVACTVKDDDSAIQCLIRMLLFYICLRGASDLHPALYSLPVDYYQETVNFVPQVKLVFREDLDDVEPNFSPIRAEISFRLMGETPETITEGKAVTLARAINQEFATGGGYRWRKGRIKASYRDLKRGYSLILAVYSETEAREVIHKILSIQNHPFEAEYFSISNWVQPPPIVPPVQRIYGESRRPPRKRPVGYVRFQYAEMHVWGLNKAVVLVDRTYRRAEPLIETL